MKTSRGLAAAVLLAAPLSAGAQSPVFTGKNTNVWHRPSPGAEELTWRFGELGARSLAADLAGGAVLVTIDRLLQDLGDGLRLVGEGQVALPSATAASIVLVNRLERSRLTPVAGAAGASSAVAPTVLTGLDAPMFGDDPEGLPLAVVASPETARTYTGPIEATVRGVAQDGGAVEVAWRRQGSAAWSAFSAGKASFTLAGDGTHTIEVMVRQGAVTKTSSFGWTIATDRGRFNDADGDGIPDAVELEAGLDPLRPEALSTDADGDGWPDFEEWLRDGDVAGTPTDDDGDGFPDVDEDLRGTASDNAAERPVVRGLFGVEAILDTRAWQDAAATVPLAGAGSAEVLDVYWNALTVRDEDGVALSFAVNGVPGDAVRPDGPAGALIELQPLALESIPGVRVPAANPLLVRVTLRAGADLATTRLASKAWVPSSPTIRPADVLAEMEANDADWADAHEWRDEFLAALGPMLVKPAVVNVSPRAGLGAALVEAAAAWYAGLDDETVLLGSDIAGEAIEGVRGLADDLDGVRFDAGGPSALDRYVAALAAQTAAGGPLAGLNALADGIWAAHATTTEGDPARPKPSATDLELARALQSHDDALAKRARYLARLLTFTGDVGVLDTSLADPDADSDGDGLTNGAELLRPRAAASDPRAADSDGDHLGDAADPCPGDATDACLVGDALAIDSDRDGIPDVNDACPDVADAWKDANGDGIHDEDANGDGTVDACEAWARITRPISSLAIRTGDRVTFESELTPKGDATGCIGLAYRWTFGGAHPDSLLADPGALVFAQPSPACAEGEPCGFEVTFAATCDGVALRTERRWIRVLGAPVMPNVVIQVDGEAVEGQPVRLTSVSTSPNGPIVSWHWTFPDGSTTTGESVTHTYAQAGAGTGSVRLTVIDAAGVTQSGVTAFKLADTAPEASFGVAGTGVDLTRRFTDRSTAYDGIATRSWDFGDGSAPVEGATVDHAFPAAGTYEVTLTVTDGDGSTAQARRLVEVGGAGIQVVHATLGDDWRFVELPVAALDPVVIAGPASAEDATPGAVRIRNVGPDGFEARFESWTGGAHGEEAVDFLAVERGRHTMPDGALWIADTVDRATPAVGAADPLPYADVPFGGAALPGTPAVFASLQTAEGTAAAVRVLDAHADGFPALVHGDEARLRAGHAAETLGFVAVYSAAPAGSVPVAGAATGWRLSTLPVSDAPAASDGCTLFLSEDVSADPETSHAEEVASLLAIGGACFAQTFTDAEDDPFTLRSIAIP